MRMLVFIVLAWLPGILQAGNWPQWRGPSAMGVSDETDLPTRWDSNGNIVWKVQIKGLGASTPIIWDKRIFITGQDGSGPVNIGFRPGNVDSHEGESVTFIVKCLSTEDGSTLWEKRLPAEGPLPPVHSMHNLASPSCVTDGERVVAWFGTGQVFCFDLEGNPLWKRHIGKEVSPFDLRWAHGSSPLIHGKFLYLLCDHNTAAYLLAIDKTNGKTEWKVDRGKEMRSYSTPFIFEADGRKELIVNSNPGLDAYDPDTGKHLWRAGSSCRVPVSIPVAADGILYASRGDRSGPYMAIRGGGSGDVTETHTLWKVSTGASYVSSPLLYQGLLYFSTENGIVRCVDPADGKTVWMERVQGKFWSSPVAADGHIFLLAESGQTVVLKAGRKVELVARNSLGEKAIASPAISSNSIFIRSEKHLYRIGDKGDTITELPANATGAVAGGQERSESGRAGGAGGQRSGRGSRRGGFDPSQWRQRAMDRLKSGLRCSDEEWKKIEPTISRIQELRSSLRPPRRWGGGGEPDPLREKLTQLAASDAPGDEALSNALKEFRNRRNAIESKIAQEREKLKKLVTPRQEASLILQEYLD